MFTCRYIFGGRRAKRLPSIVEAASLQLVGKPDPARQQGGTNHETGHNPLTLKDIWGYDILLNEWFEVVPTAGSAIPVERQGHRTVIWDDMMYVYGGYEAPIQYLNDTWHFNLTAKVWHSKIIEQTGTPIRRSQYGIAVTYVCDLVCLAPFFKLLSSCCTDMDPAPTPYAVSSLFLIGSRCAFRCGIAL